MQLFGLVAVTYLTACLMGTPMVYEARSSDDPIVVKAVMPSYPAIAAAKRISGKVLIEVEVNAKGDVTKVSATKGHPILRRSAVQAASRWRFNAVDREGFRSVQLTFVFVKTSVHKTNGFHPPYKMVVTWEGVSSAAKHLQRPSKLECTLLPRPPSIHQT